MRTDELDFALPAELIAQHPPAIRGESRLLHYRRADRSITHRAFSDFPSLLRIDDLLVLNNAKVLPAKFALRKATGGRVEGLFVRQRTDGCWVALLKNLGSLSHGSRLTFEADSSLGAALLGREDDAYVLKLESQDSPQEILSRIGRMPLPPYIRRDKGLDSQDAEDAERYQTVYAAAAGSIAAPTAGLHFTPALFADLDRRSIERAFITLHVGAGTFKPVTAEDLGHHAMHTERYAIDASTANTLNAATLAKRRIIAVGTTSARVLESQPTDAPVLTGDGETSILIYPPYRWRRVGALLTNFHLPRSTLVALVAAFVGLDEQRLIYREAIAQRYRFFSYGDAMFIE